MKLKILSLVTAVFINIFTGCRSVSPDKLQINSYIPDENWRSTYPERVGIERPVISKFIHNISRKNIELHNLLIIKNGYLVTNAEMANYKSENLHDIASVTKSVMGLLIGIAVEEKFIESEEVYVSDIIDSFSNLKRVKIKHLLSMTSGIECVNKVTDETPFAETSLLNMMISSDWGKYISSLNVVDNPGDRFSYNSINYHILSMIIGEVYGSSAEDFAVEYLFKPLGIKKYKWESDRAGNNYGWGSLKLRSLDLARIAYLVSNKGVWAERIVIPEKWIDKVLIKHSTASSNPFFSLNYGYGWFIPKGISSNYFAALGRGGQTIFIFPEEDIIIQTFGNYDIGKLIFQIPELAKSSTSFVEDDIWDRYYGDWSLEDNIFNLETFAVNKVDNNKKELVLKGDIFNLEILLTNTGDLYLSRNSFNSENVETSWHIDEENILSIKVNEIENINTFYITLRDDLSVHIKEHQLVPKGYTIKLKKKE